jgi:tetratricopeptide (TPR) repeat protein
MRPVLAPSLDRSWRLSSPSDLGSARFAFSGDEVQVVRRLKEPTRVADLLDTPPRDVALRVVLLLALAGLVENVESPLTAAEPPLRPPPLVEPTSPPAQTPTSKAIAAELAARRTRALMGLTGASAGAGRPTARAGLDAVDAITALQGRQAAAARTTHAEPPAAPETYFQRGRADLEQGRLPAARQHFENAYAGNPSSDYRLYLAWAQYLTANPESVAQQRETLELCVLECLRADRRMAFAHYVTGRLALVDGQFAAAEKSLKYAVAIDANLTDAARSLRLVQHRLAGKK